MKDSRFRCRDWHASSFTMSRSKTSLGTDEQNSNEVSILCIDESEIKEQSAESNGQRDSLTPLGNWAGHVQWSRGHVVWSSNGISFLQETQIAQGSRPVALIVHV